MAYFAKVAVTYRLSHSLSKLSNYFGKTRFEFRVYLIMRHFVKHT